MPLSTPSMYLQKPFSRMCVCFLLYNPPLMKIYAPLPLHNFFLFCCFNENFPSSTLICENTCSSCRISILLIVIVQWIWVTIPCNNLFFYMYDCTSVCSLTHCNICSCAEVYVSSQWNASPPCLIKFKSLHAVLLYLCTEWKAYLF